jgi:hypothetical protein
MITIYKGNKKKLRWPIQNQQNIKVKLKEKKQQKLFNQKKKKLEDRLLFF